MTVFATDSNRLSTVVKFELKPNLGVCRDILTVNDSAQTYKVGAVLGKYYASPAATSAAGAGNTGNGAMGSITVTSNKNLKLGVYTLRIIKAATNAGDFIVTNPDGRVVGYGTVAVAYSQGGLAFTLADGSTDFAVGDTFSITVTGTEKYKLVEATATDGSEVAAAIFIGDKLGNSGDLAIAGSTDTSVLAITRGPVIVSKDGLSYGASIDTQGEKDTLYSQLKALGIYAETSN
jgi:hypothetical protein